MYSTIKTFPYCALPVPCFLRAGLVGLLVRHRSTILGIHYFSGMKEDSVLTAVMGYLIDQLGFCLSSTIAGSALVAVTLTCSVFLLGNQD